MEYKAWYVCIPGYEWDYGGVVVHTETRNRARYIGAGWIDMWHEYPIITARRVQSQDTQEDICPACGEKMTVYKQYTICHKCYGGKEYEDEFKY